MVESNEDLEKTYGPAAPFSEHKRGEYIHYIDASGKQLAGLIIWVQSATDAIGQRLVVAPDDAGAFLDFVVPGDVLQVETSSFVTSHSWAVQTGKPPCQSPGRFLHS